MFFTRLSQINLPELATIKCWAGVSKLKPDLNFSLFKQIKLKISTIFYGETFSYFNI